MKRNLNCRGLTSLELIAAAGLTGFALLTLGTGLNQGISLTKRSLSKGEYEVQLLNAANLIRRVGRAADPQTDPNGGCVKLAPPEIGIDCSIHFEEGVQSRAKFSFEPSLLNPGQNDLVYRRQVVLSGVWTIYATFSGIDEFTVCDQADIIDDVSADPSTCNIEPRQMNEFVATTHSLNPGENRIFRFRIAGSGGLNYQGAFYIRNPTPIAGVVYKYAGAN